MSLGKVVIANGSAMKVEVGANKFEVTQQDAILHTSDGQVRKFKLALAKGADPYPVGEYTLSDESLSVDEYGRLGLGFSVKLVAVKAASGLARAS